MIKLHRVVIACRNCVDRVTRNRCFAHTYRRLPNRRSQSWCGRRARPRTPHSCTCPTRPHSARPASAGSRWRPRAAEIKKNVEIIVCKKRSTMSHNLVWLGMCHARSNYVSNGDRWTWTAVIMATWDSDAVGGSSSHLGFAHVWDNRGFHTAMNIVMVDLVDSIVGY